jgi:glycosyltransferase involved in cell wall biosynthesis
VIRAGFIINGGAQWIGGVNYYSNLLHAICRSKRIEPVILTGLNTPPAFLEQFPVVEIQRSRILESSGKWMLARKIPEAVHGRAFLLERFMRSRGISVLSHSGHLGRNSRFPSIGWIPDFQHVRMPEFFSDEERKSRDRGFARLADFCTRVIVSSESARADFAAFRPAAEHKARILRFVAGLNNTPNSMPTREALLAQFAIERPYFYLPNQFWRHKNHGIVVDALQQARSRGRRISVVATGSPADLRHPGYFAELMNRAKESGCDSDFKVLGIVSYAEVHSLMLHSVAVINPSLFEGWSTTVEEAKSLGKTVILSDIPVHREQAPERGRFFDPGSSSSLTDQMLYVLDNFSSEREDQQLSDARANLPHRVRNFAAHFEQIIFEAAESAK